MLVLVAIAPLITVAQNERTPFQPVTDAMLQKPDPAHWLMWRRTLDSWGYSPLDQVNRSNVNQLRMVWSRGMGSGTSVSGYPITFAAGGKQYVAVSTGASLVAGSVMTLTPELKPGSGSQMFVFALP